MPRKYITMEEKKIKYGFGTSDTHCEPWTFDSVEELLEYAQDSWDSQDGNPFDEDCEYSGYIYVGVAKTLEPSDFAPSLDDIADTMTDKFYSEHNIDDDADVQIVKHKEAEEELKAFINKYFDLPCTMVTNWNIGLYNLKEHSWAEKYSGFDKHIKG